MDADASEVSLKKSFTYRHCLGLLESDKFGTCQATSMGHPYLQPSKKGHQQSNKQLREGAFHHFSVFLPLLQLAAPARQCHLAPLFDMHLLTPNKNIAII